MALRKSYLISSCQGNHPVIKKKKKIKNKKRLHNSETCKKFALRHELNCPTIKPGRSQNVFFLVKLGSDRELNYLRKGGRLVKVVGDEKGGKSSLGVPQ